MALCELCGQDSQSLQETKIEGAKLNVCGNCKSHGTVLDSDDTDSEGASTKYSTDGSQSTETYSENGSSSSDPFEEQDTLAPDYNEQIQQARERKGVSRNELADQLNEKQSHLRRLERGKSLPSDRMQRKLEGALGIDLSAEEDY